ncbi:MAG: hypothetical protein WAO69_08630 [Aestuariivita sp.]|uniref:hypothetical protein n=1 Tax=Aestuariivita sp. TaxID=1872407 RepID=UPI003BB09CB7
MFITGLIGAVIGFALGFTLCFVINLLRYGPDDPPWPYDEFLYEAIVIVCGIIGSITALLLEDRLLSLL